MFSLNVPQVTLQRPVLLMKKNISAFFMLTNHIEWSNLKLHLKVFLFNLMKSIKSWKIRIEMYVKIPAYIVMLEPHLDTFNL